MNFSVGYMVLISCPTGYGCFYLGVCVCVCVTFEVFCCCLYVLFCLLLLFVWLVGFLLLFWLRPRLHLCP